MFGLLKRKPKDIGGQEQWAIAQGNENNCFILVRYRRETPREANISKYPRLINIYWRYAPINEKGMPESDDYERMLGLEAELEALETPQLGFLVLSITGNSRKEWVWYVQSDQAFIHALNSQLLGKAPFPIEIEASDDKGWSKYFEFLKQTGS
jgi:hypothetical protein